MPEFAFELEPGGDQTYMDLSRTTAEAGYTPEYGVERGVADYIDWLKTHPQ